MITKAQKEQVNDLENKFFKDLQEILWQSPFSNIELVKVWKDLDSWILMYIWIEDSSGVAIETIRDVATIELEEFGEISE